MIAIVVIVEIVGINTVTHDSLVGSTTPRSIVIPFACHTRGERPTIRSASLARDEQEHCHPQTSQRQPHLQVAESSRLPQGFYKAIQVVERSTLRMAGDLFESRRIAFREENE